LNQRKIYLNKESITKRLIGFSPGDFKIILYGKNDVEDFLNFKNEWETGEFFYNFRPSNRVRGFLIASSEHIVISDKKKIMDENVLDFIMIVKQSHDDGIPLRSDIYMRDGSGIHHQTNPFFLMEDVVEFNIKESEFNTLLVFQAGLEKSFYSEAIKLLEDAGYLFTHSEIIRDLSHGERSIRNFLSRVEERLDDVSTIAFAGDINKNIQAKLERETEKIVIDREELIISIFEKRANASSGKIKVAASMIAREKSTFKNRIKGLSRIKGGIGLKGPGETKEEERKRILKNREKSVKKALLKESERLEFQRKFRKKSNYPTVSIVGYTNAGKSTLFNTLLGEKVVEESKHYFSSIDPKIRLYSLFGQKIFLVDTVGIIEGMTKGIVDAFNPTFQEIINSDLIFHVVDSTERTWKEKKKYVEKMLAENGVKLDLIFPLYSKKDKLTLPHTAPDGFCYSIGSKDDIFKIKEMIAEILFSS